MEPIISWLINGNVILVVYNWCYFVNECILYKVTDLCSYGVSVVRDFAACMLFTWPCFGGVSSIWRPDWPRRPSVQCLLHGHRPTHCDPNVTDCHHVCTITPRGSSRGWQDQCGVAVNDCQGSSISEVTSHMKNVNKLGRSVCLHRFFCPLCSQRWWDDKCLVLTFFPQQLQTKATVLMVALRVWPYTCHSCFTAQVMQKTTLHGQLI